MSSSYKIPRNISFRVETLFAKNNNRVGRVIPDENGIYKGLPMMVLGQVTQQKTYYDPQSMIDQITNPNTRFNMVLRQGKLAGEYGHPSFIGMMSESDQLQRLVTVDEKSTSHIFTSLYTDPLTPEGNIVVRGDIKPTGPMGSVLKDSLDDPVINTAFSLRAYVDTKMNPDGVKYRTVRSLVTFDCVTSSGFFGTDKSHALALEHLAGGEYLDHEIQVMEDGNILISQIALESIMNEEMNDILQSSNIQRVIQSQTMITPDQSLHERFPNLYRKSVFHEFFKEI
jgi:hypothetical protein